MKVLGVALLAFLVLYKDLNGNLSIRVGGAFWDLSVGLMSYVPGFICLPAKVYARM